ncbi:hypothetical protein Rhal01_00559 [Rubritalea halochordaticola]|uniref:Lipoprotein n=1 Tax=Rubritalea halochordaticola TaxID=714537 RepID=A0ABP9UW06_9BACT
MLENIFKIIIGIALCSLVSCDKEKNGTLTDKDAIDSIDAKEKVTDCFNGYKESILAEDGDKAVKFLSSGTVELYQKYVDLALDAEKDEIQKLSFINRMQAIFIRHRVAPDKLRLFDGREALVYAVNNGWIGRDETIGTSLGEVYASGDKAVANVIIKGTPTNQSFHFVCEDGVWKMDLEKLLVATNVQMKRVVQESGMGEDQFIFTVLESVSGKKVQDSVWDPVGR